MVKTPGFNAQGMGSIPGQRTKIPHAMRHGQKKKKSIQVLAGSYGLSRCVLIPFRLEPQEMGEMTPFYRWGD